MEIRKLKISSKGYSNEHITFIVEHLVDDYPLPEMEHVHIRTTHDGYAVGRVFTDWDNTVDDQVIDNRVKKVFDTRLKRWTDPENVNEYNVCSFDGEETSTYFSLTFWKPKEGTLEEVITKYMGMFHTYILGKWNKRGADDDFYDYLPSLTDLFRQLAEAIGEPAWYNNLLQQIEKQEACAPEDWDPPFYVQKLTV